MERYIREKCIQGGCCPSLYVDESFLVTIRNSLKEINLDVIEFKDVLIKPADPAGLEMELVKLVHIKRNDSQTIKTLCSTLSRMKFVFAYPWHQLWFRNTPTLNVALESLDIFDLISLQIDSNQLHYKITDLIKSKLNLGTVKFDLNKYLFDNNRVTIQEEILLYFLYYYGRYRYKEVVWLNDFRGSAMFDACVFEMQLTMINLRYVQLNLDDYDDADELIHRLWSSKHHFAIIIGSQFSTKRFYNLVLCDSVQEIYLDIGLGDDYSDLDDYELEYDKFAGRSDDRKFIFIRNTRQSNEVKQFIKYFIRFCNCSRQKRYFYLTLDGIELDDWSLLNGLNLSEISFKNIELTSEDVLQLARTTMSTSLKLIDCENFGDVMLLKFLELCDWIKNLRILGRSAITEYFFQQYARQQIVYNDLNYYDFREHELSIEVEGFEVYTTSGMFSTDEFIEDY